jgi:hypothetical protein
MLPFKHFAKWCYRVSYHTSKGKYAESYTVDRVNVNPANGFWGYRIDNIQKLTRKKNSEKRNLEYDYVNGQFIISKTFRATPEPNDYF